MEGFREIFFFYISKLMFFLNLQGQACETLIKRKLKTTKKKM